VNLVQLARRTRRSESRYSLDQFIADAATFAFAGNTYGLTDTYGTTTDRPTERTESPFAHWVGAAYKANGVVFACQVARLRLFSEARLQYRALRGGRTGELFGTPDLRVLERPWPNGSTGELLARMIQDADLAGNAYVRRTGPLAEPRLERLRPDWVTIVLDANPDLLNPEVVGYIFEPGGPGNGRPQFLNRDEVAHWSPLPDPIASYRGMSWLTPILRDISGDKAAAEHKTKFFDNAATPNMVVKFDPTVVVDAIKRFKELFEAEYAGPANAGKTLFLGGGADATVVGHSFKEMDLKAITALGETRVASAAGVPPIVVGLSEGLAAATYSNYGQAMRSFGNTMSHFWRTACVALETVVPAPAGSELWFDVRDVPALQQDEKDAADIQGVRAATITQLIREGFTADSVIRAVEADDFRLLAHTGRLSVQLQGPESEQDSGAGAARNLVEMIQKVYLGVGVVITADEARDLLNKAGAGLPATPAELAPPSTNGTAPATEVNS
jgi:phage portal protein BeeE